MSLQVTKTDEGAVYDPVFSGLLEDIPGGITVATDRFPTATKEIKKGALLNDGGSGLFNVIKTVKTTAANGAGATVLAIIPTDHLFNVGNYIFLWGAIASKITRVSSTAIAFAVGVTTAGKVASGAVLYETATVATATALYDADCILRDNIQVRDEKGEKLANIFAGAIVHGTVDESEIPYFVTDADKVALTDRIRWA